MNQSVSARTERALAQRPFLILTAIGASLVATGCSGSSSPEGDGPDAGPSASGAGVTGVIQDRTFDSTGSTLIVTFEAGIEQVDAEDETYYSVFPRTVVSAIQVTPSLVRLTLDGTAVPGDVTLSVSEGIQDLEGETSPGVQGLAIESTDTSAPEATRLSAMAISGSDNDQLEVVFDDDMVEADIVSLARWSVESPLGTPVDLAGVELTYGSADRKATLTFEGGQNLQTSDSVAVIVTSVRDIAGNTIESTTFGVDAISSSVQGDKVAPRLLSAYPGVTANTMRLVFDEPVKFVETADLIGSVPVAGTRFTFAEASSPGVDIAALGSTSAVQGLGAEVTFAVAPEAGDTVTVFAVADLAGNVMSPEFTFPVEARDETPPEILAGGVTLTAVEGERNDLLTVQFDRPVHPEGLADTERYGLLFGFFETLEGAAGTWNGSDQISFLLEGENDHDVQAGGIYALAVVRIQSLQGVQVDELTQEGNIVAAGDSAPPSVLSARVHPSLAGAVVVEFSEAVRADLAAAAASFQISGQAASSAEALSPRVVRVTFGSTPVIGAVLDVTSTALTDRAGNEAVSDAAVSIQAADAIAPGMTVGAETIPGTARDLVTAQFTEGVDPDTILDASNWSCTQGGVALSLEGAKFSYASSSRTLTISLPETAYLETGATVSLTAASLLDTSGNLAVSVVDAATVTGDSTGPSGLGAFVNYRKATDGTVIDVFPNEGLDGTVASAVEWTASGGQTVLSAEAITPNRFRVTLDAALGASETLTLLSVIDLAGNDSGGTLVVDPAE